MSNPNPFISMRKLYYRKFCQLLTLMLVVIGISHQARAQSTTITGRVTTTDGAEPLPGVSVVVKGTTDGTITDVNGKYSIAVPSRESVLLFSYIGHLSEEVVVGERSSIDVSMTPDILTLNEVVV